MEAINAFMSMVLAEVTPAGINENPTLAAADPLTKETTHTKPKSAKRKKQPAKTK
jgi:hypothetical protein